ncbi:MAG: GntR family transcriptional regulator [Microbacterium sp.]|uniref:GntR family transcriptional regulator n=1 Tax=Microbacterium sp. TaxID=51671 RepID=UPI0039E4C50B
MTTDAVDSRVGAVKRTDFVYRQLRENILNGALRPNEALVEADIAERLQVSRTPVRESLQRLAADGLIESRRRRWVVHEHAYDEITQVYEVRAALESYAARLAATRGTDEQKAELEAFRESATATDLTADARMKANSQFHRLVVRAANNPRIEQLLANNEVYHFNSRVAMLYSPADIQLSAEQHAETLDAILAGDVDRAGECAREHVEFSLAIIARAFPPGRAAG